VIRINTRGELLKLKEELGVRADWHEPDEQEVAAKVFGHGFDNAGFWGPGVDPYLPYAEQHVVIYHSGVAVAAVNLATLFAWATGYDPSSPRMPDGYRVVDPATDAPITKILPLDKATAEKNRLNRLGALRGGTGRAYEVQPAYRPRNEQEEMVVEEEVVTVTVVGRGLPADAVHEAFSRSSR